MIRNPSVGDAHLPRGWTAGEHAAHPSRRKGFSAATLGRIAASSWIDRLRRKIATLISPKRGRVLEADRDDLRRARGVVAAKALDHVSGLHHMEPTALAFPDASFDLVAAFFVIGRRQRPKRVIDELVRVTKPGGRIVVVNRLSAHAGRAGPAPRQTRSLWRVLRLGRLAPPLGLLWKRRELELLDRRAFGPFGLLTVCEFAKRA